jgi:beta-glucanase (GH16 family)
MIIEKKTLQLLITLSVLLFFSCSEDSNGALVEGCTDTDACNYNSDANEDDGSCEYDTDIVGNCCVDDVVDCTGVCGGSYEFDDCEKCKIPDGPSWNSSCSGCMNTAAINYNPDATIDANCVYDGFADTTQWELVWNDEFNLSNIDQSKWNHEEWGPGMVNKELQAYTNSTINSYIEDSCLVIRALHENYDGANYTSARMNSAGKGDFLYGKIDIKAKLPSGDGTWPAIWMLPTYPAYWEDENWWPASGEIDIMEHVGCNLNWVKGSVHTEDCNWDDGCPNQSAGGNGQEHYVPGVSDNFNIYSIEWSASKIDFFINNNHYWTFTNIGEGSGMWPFDQEFHIILNLAIGGSWGGICPIDNSSFPQEMKVDFVRVYESVN